jgi:hypothetical protein
MSREEQVDSIINANLYVVKCKFCVNCCKKTEHARKYLSLKIGSMISKTRRTEKVSYVSVFSGFFSIFF